MFSKSFLFIFSFIILLLTDVQCEEGRKVKKPNIFKRIQQRWDKFTDRPFFQPRPGFNNDQVYLDVPGNIYADGSPVGQGVETVPLMWTFLPLIFQSKILSNSNGEQNAKVQPMSCFWMWKMWFLQIFPQIFSTILGDTRKYHMRCSHAQNICPNKKLPNSIISHNNS